MKIETGSPYLNLPPRTRVLAGLEALDPLFAKQAKAAATAWRKLQAAETTITATGGARGIGITEVAAALRGLLQATDAIADSILGPETEIDAGSRPQDLPALPMGRLGFQSSPPIQACIHCGDTLIRHTPSGRCVGKRTKFTEPGL